MKGVKGKLLKKFKPTKQERILHVNAADGLVDDFTDNPALESETEQQKIEQSCMAMEVAEIIDVAELMRDLEDDEMDSDYDDVANDKENAKPQKDSDFSKKNLGNLLKLERKYGQIRLTETPLSEIDISPFRRPETNFGELLYPNTVSEEEVQKRAIVSTQYKNLLLSFKEKCPPGGSDSVILYTTTLGGIRKTFEDCNNVRALLDSYKIIYFERDMSMHNEFKEELWQILGGKEVPPCLFIKGRYIGGAEAVFRLHEDGRLQELLAGIPADRWAGACEWCGGVKFVLCFKCNGSHKTVSVDGMFRVCCVCNENGLIICPMCC